MSPSSTVWIVTAPRGGAATSTATFPWRRMKKWWASSPSRKRNCPASKRSLRAQPATVAICAGVRPLRNGCSASRGSSVSIGPPSGGRRGPGGLECAGFLREVDPHGTPRDAAAAADAAGLTELVDPRRELVRHPLAVPRGRAPPDAASVDVGEVEGVARVPPPPALGRGASQVRGILDRRAEARRAYHRAVRAGEAALGDLLPARALGAGGQELLQAGEVEPAAHRRLRAPRRRACGVEVLLARGAGRDPLEERFAARGVDLDEDLAPAGVEELREGEVEAGGGAGAGAHRGAEARAFGLRALDRDDKGRLAPRPVSRVPVGASEEDAVLAGDRRDVAGPHAEEGEGARIRRVGLNLERLFPTGHGEEPPRSGEEELLPGVRPGGVAEQGAVAAGPEPVAAVRLFLSDPRRKPGRGGDLVVDDRPVLDGRPEESVARFEDDVEKRGDLRRLDHAGRGARRLRRGIHSGPSNKEMGRRGLGVKGARCSGAPPGPMMDSAFWEDLNEGLHLIPSQREAGPARRGR